MTEMYVLLGAAAVMAAGAVAVLVWPRAKAPAAPKLIEAQPLIQAVPAWTVDNVINLDEIDRRARAAAVSRVTERAVSAKAELETKTLTDALTEEAGTAK